MSTEHAKDMTIVEEDESSSNSRVARKSKKRERIRVVPIWLRLFIVLVLVLGSLAAGLMVGYGVIGEGLPIDALKADTWRHIANLINGIT